MSLSNASFDILLSNSLPRFERKPELDECEEGVASEYLELVLLLQTLLDYIPSNVEEGKSFLYIAKGGASRGLMDLIQDHLDWYIEGTENETIDGCQGFFPWLEQEDETIFQRAIKQTMHRDEGIKFIIEATRGPPALKPDGSSFHSSHFMEVLDQ